MTMRQRIIKIGEASEMLGVNPKTLRKWEGDGFIKPEFKSPAGTRFYSIDKLKTVCDSKK